MDPIPFAIVGRGWRGAFYERVAAALPDRFRITGTMSGRTPGSRASLDELLADEPAFVVLAVPWDPMPALIAELADRGVAVLAETPPAPDLDGLRSLRRLTAAGGRIQVAEQYRYQPLHAARLALVASGRLGTISQVQLSVAHGYHGIDLLRRFLGIDAEPVTISARRVRSPIVAGPDRAGPPADERIVEADQVIATFAFGDGARGADGAHERLGILDFTDEQYFSWIRGLRLLIRGERGEIDGTAARWLAGAHTPIRVALERHDTGQDGNLEGHYLAGITAGSEWVYRNPFAPARLTDDEIAVATCLAGMPAAIAGGPDVCSLADAVQDRYLDILVAEAAATGRPMRAEGHLWDGG
jgi:predicted dehydrogenase